MQDTYKTRDIHEASFLFASQCKLLTLESSENGYFFIFQNLSTCQQLADSYWDKTGVVVAKDLADSFGVLKRKVFQS